MGMETLGRGLPYERDVDRDPWGITPIRKGMWMETLGGGLHLKGMGIPVVSFGGVNFDSWCQSVQGRMPIFLAVVDSFRVACEHETKKCH